MRTVVKNGLYRNSTYVWQLLRRVQTDLIRKACHFLSRLCSWNSTSRIATGSKCMCLAAEQKNREVSIVLLEATSDSVNKPMTPPRVPASPAADRMGSPRFYKERGVPGLQGPTPSRKPRSLGQCLTAELPLFSCPPSLGVRTLPPWVLLPGRAANGLICTHDCSSGPSVLC